MTTHIIVNSLGLTYKGTIGISTATIPDVCKTPSPGGPVPIPYPNIAMQSTLKGGTTTVKAKGQMIAVKGSQYGSSNGDEAGTAGGVKSGVNMKATDWITYSFDVKFDGKNACRHTDKMFHNNQNAANLCGNVDAALAGHAALHDILCACNKKCDGEQAQKKLNCRQLGTAKHKCCDEGVAKHNKSGNSPVLDQEKAYDRTTGEHFPDASREWQPGQTPKDYFSGISGKIFPDAAIRAPDGSILSFVEFKFQCPEGTPTRKKKDGTDAAPSKGASKPGWTPGRKGKPGQWQRTKELMKNLKAPDGPVTKGPIMMTNMKCP